MSGRRVFLQTSAWAGAALIVRVGEAKGAGPGADFRPGVRLRIDGAGRTTLVVDKSEMGQGARTALAMILADELGADWARVDVQHAEPGPDFPDMHTAGSGTVIEAWKPLREAAASARVRLVAAAALAWKVSEAECQATDGFVEHPATGRRRGFGELVAVAAALPVPKDPPLRDAKERRIVGQPVKRVDGPKIVMGAAVYGGDVRVPGMLFATIERSPVLGGKLKGFDPSRAKAVPGVRAVFEVPSGVAVVASDTWSALKGREALDVSWDEGPHAAFGSETHRAALRSAARKGLHVARAEGDVDTALRSAARTLEAEYEYSFQAHASVETLCCVVDVRADRCEIWAGTQSPNRAQQIAAEVTGLPKDRVSVHVLLLGGAFGRRIAQDFVREAAFVSKAAKAPVQLLWTRADDTHHDFFHPATAHFLRGGLDTAGNPVAWSHSVADSYLTMFGPPDLGDPETFETWGAYDNPYAFPAFRTDYGFVDSPVPTGAWRSVFYPPSVFARESFVDEMAAAAGRDPLDFRRALLREPRILTLHDRPYDRHRLRRVLDLAAEKGDWGRPLPKGRGRGIAVNMYHRRTCVAQVAEVTVEDGHLRVDRIVCVVDCGVVVNPLGAVGQVESAVAWGLSAALKGRITFRNGRPEQSSYRDYPVLAFDEMPKVEVYFAPTEGEIPSGLGEQPVPTVAPAVTGAVFAATGKRIRRLPVRAADL